MLEAKRVFEELAKAREALVTACNIVDKAYTYTNDEAEESAFFDAEMDIRDVIYEIDKLYDIIERLPY